MLELTRRFDGAGLTADRLAVTRAELMSASLEADAELRRAVAEADKNIAGFARKSLRRNWGMRNSHGARVGERFDPFQRVGIYIPGGTAPLVSTALMTVTLARVAGCPEIVVCTPCGKDGAHSDFMHHEGVKLWGDDVLAFWFGEPDEVREFPKGRLELIKIGGATVGRATFEPGWRWATCGIAM